MSEHSVDHDAQCVRCAVEDTRVEPASMTARHPHAGNTIPVCDRHGTDLLATGWTRVIPEGERGERDA